MMYRRIQKLCYTGCFLGALFGSSLPATAQFVPHKGVIAKHWKDPKEGQSFDGCNWLNDHESDSPPGTPSEPQKSSAIKLDLPPLVYPYYEWVARDTALAWVEKPDGSVVGVPITGEDREEQRIGGASASKERRHGHPYALKMSPDGSKVLYLIGGLGGQASGWQAGNLNGTDYTHGPLLFPQGWELVWSRNSKEWVSLQRVSIIDGHLCGTVTHYYIDGITPPKNVPINPSLLKHAPLDIYVNIVGLRQDGIAIVPVKNRSIKTEKTASVDIYLIDIDNGRVLTGKHHVLLPKDVYLWGMELSHSGNRIAWLLGSESIRVPDSDAPPDYILDLWLSNSDGSDLKRLPGFPPHKIEDPLPGQPAPQLSTICPIRWTVDDTAISCLAGNRLQIVPVPSPRMLPRALNIP